MTETSTPICILFDLDGTLIDTAPGLAATMNTLLARHGRPGLDPQQLRPFISHGAKAIISHAMAATGTAAAPERIDAMFAEFLDHYRANMAAVSQPYPGVAACLEVLGQRGYRLGICTNRFEASARELIAALGLSDHFGAITGQDTFGIGKPDPKPVLNTLAELGGAPGRGVFVGDSEIDVAAARASGLPAIVTSFGYGAMPAAEMEADAVIGHFDELSHFVEALVNS